MVTESSGNEATPEDEENVREDATEHTSLYNPDLVVLESHNADLYTSLVAVMKMQGLNTQSIPQRYRMSHS